MSDFVFRKRGDRLHFVGDFDGLYSAEPDPWAQSGKRGPMASYYRASRIRLTGALRRHAPNFKRGLEIGCGSGFLLKQLTEHVPGRWEGMDVSGVAAERARNLNPDCAVYLGDIAASDPMPPSALARYDAVILSQLLWYVLTRLDAAVVNATRLARLGGLVVVTQAFLREPQRYGAHIADGWRGALALFLKRYPALELIEARYDDSDTHAHHDGLMVFRKIANVE